VASFVVNNNDPEGKVEFIITAADMDGNITACSSKPLPILSDCPTTDGSFVVIDKTPPPADVCPNLPGAQAEVPEGYELVGGDCVPLPPDTTPPAAPSASVSQCEYSLVEDYCLVPVVEVDVEWDAVADADHYNVFINGTEQPDTTSTSATLTLPDEAESTLQVVAEDAAGNQATSTPVVLTVFTQPLIINEIAWAGTNATSSDQWIELRGLTSYWLDFEHLTLKGSTGRDVVLEPITSFYYANGRDPNLPALGYAYYAFARVDGTLTTPTVPTLSFNALSTTTAEELTLVWEGPDGEVIIDQTPAVGACGTGWCAGFLTIGPPSPVPPFLPVRDARSMERVEGATDGSSSASWATFILSHVHDGSTPKDRNGVPVRGTPRTNNSN
jgi:hypothetical protein